jgi:hypothetical protein
VLLSHNTNSNPLQLINTQEHYVLRRIAPPPATPKPQQRRMPKFSAALNRTLTRTFSRAPSTSRAHYRPDSSDSSHCEDDKFAPELPVGDRRVTQSSPAATWPSLSRLRSNFLAAVGSGSGGSSSVASRQGQGIGLQQQQGLQPSSSGSVIKSSGSSRLFGLVMQVKSSSAAAAGPSSRDVTAAAAANRRSIATGRPVGEGRETGSSSIDAAAQRDADTASAVPTVQLRDISFGHVLPASQQQQQQPDSQLALDDNSSSSALGSSSHSKPEPTDSTQQQQQQQVESQQQSAAEMPPSAFHFAAGPPLIEQGTVDWLGSCDLQQQQQHQQQQQQLPGSPTGRRTVHFSEPAVEKCPTSPATNDNSSWDAVSPDSAAAAAASVPHAAAAATSSQYSISPKLTLVYKDVFVADKPLKRGLGATLAGLCQRRGKMTTGDEQHSEDAAAAAAAKKGPDMDAAAAAGATFIVPGEVTACELQLLNIIHLCLPVEELLLVMCLQTFKVHQCQAATVVGPGVMFQAAVLKLQHVGDLETPYTCWLSALCDRRSEHICCCCCCCVTSRCEWHVCTLAASCRDGAKRLVSATSLGLSHKF